MSVQTMRARKRGRWLRPLPVVVPTLRTCLVIAAFTIALGLYCVTHLRPLLAPEEPAENAHVLVIEADPSRRLLEYLRPKLKAGKYRRVLPVGGPIDAISPLAPLGTTADVWAALLERIGVPADAIQVVRLPPLSRNSTAYGALAVARHLGKAPPALDVLSTSFHGRRTQLLYRTALAPTQVGILSAPLEQDSGSWWRTSGGVRAAVTELLALAYFYLGGNELEQAERKWKSLTPVEARATGSTALELK